MPALLNRRHNPLASRLAETELQLVSAKEAVREVEAENARLRGQVTRQTEHAASCEREAERCREEMHRLRVLLGQETILGPALPWERSERARLVRVGTLGQQLQLIAHDCLPYDVSSLATKNGREIESLCRRKLEGL